MKTLEKVIKEAVGSKKVKCGVREATASVKGSKLLIVSRSIDSEDRSRLEEQAKNASVPVYEFEGNSVQLGKLCNRPFRITAVAIKSGTNEEIQAVLAEKNETATKRTK